MRKFRKKKGPRRSFLKVMARNLIIREKIETTEVRAKELKSFMERLVSIARKQNLAALRILLSRLSKDAANKLYYDLAPKYKDRASGQLRVIKMGGVRKRDAAKKAIVEFV